MAVDCLSSGKRQRRMIFFAQRRKGAKINAGNGAFPRTPCLTPAAAILAFDLTVVMDESGNDLAGNISLRRRCTAANSKP
jgi:hypothetical protein